ncbi:CopY/TcrY family copper transport repressor [Streptohalobacillus salinus]|uniref:CopY/TcrY family copper transport repressor n=1 Tax=Streptohalobacillus salinus TaxID=621096 RepID=A0A2V3WFL4_9BACI|nr:CopY/TcrY family copper transport repressor [Streptohalobacillus salinus]PXW91005.1 CopY/TcrY family copper transport repressor [Streptohalobacillus salinus]
MAIEMDQHITNAEWEVMRVVWAQGEVSSKVIIEVLSKKRGWKEATIKTLIGRLVNKRVLQTKKEGRKFIYSTEVEEDALVNDTLDQFFHNVCSKDVGQTIQVLIEKAMLSHEDIASLKQALIRKEREAYDVVPCNCIKGQCRCHHNKNNEECC